MKPETIHHLNKLNHDFYATVANDFDQTRSGAWPGWQRLLPYLNLPLSVLDVGCGNARFGLFLGKELLKGDGLSADSDRPVDITYHGVDSSPSLLAHAHDSPAGKPGLTFRLEERDIIENPLDTGEYDVVALLGVLHHIPGYEQRQQFMRQLAARVKAGGLLFFTAWRFYEYERYRERIVPWPQYIQVEANDFLLDWRRGTISLRYCHYTDDTEHEAIVAATALTEIATYRADGQNGTANRYSLLRK